MARRRDHVAVNISRGARRARLGVWMRWSAGTWKILAGHLRANSLTIFLDLTASRSFFDDYSACRSFVWGPHPPLRNFIFSSSLDTRSAARYIGSGGGALGGFHHRTSLGSRACASKAIRARRRRAKRLERRTSSPFAQGAHSRQARPPASAGGDESGWMHLSLSVASPSATFPHQRRVFRRRGMGAACTSPKASSAASPETVSPAAGPSLERIPAAGASRRASRIPSSPPLAASPRLASSFPARAHLTPPPLSPSPPFPPRSRRKQNRGGAR